MATLSEYFAKERPQPFFEFGTRVYGKYNKIPFIGTIYTDNMVNEEQGPRLSIHLDLPIMVDGNVKTIIIDTYDKFKGLSELTDPDAPVAERKARASKTHGRGFESHRAHQKSKIETSRSATLLENLKKIRGNTNVSNTKKSGKRTSR